jgi:hypothetical protein
MSKRKLRRGVNGSDPTIRRVELHHYVLKSAAWESLPGDAIKLLIDVWKRHNGANNGEISYSCREAERIGLTQWQASRMFAILIERGFLVVVKNACFKAKDKKARVWRLTDEPYRSEPATKEFMSWRPPLTSDASREFFTVAPMLPDSSTGATLADESAVTVAPTLLKGPISTDPQSHQCYTYNLPWDGRTKRVPLPADWRPGRRATVEAKVEGLPTSRIFDVMALFRERYLDSGVTSDDWLREWRNFVREFLQKEKEAQNFWPRADEKHINATKGVPT